MSAAPDPAAGGLWELVLVEGLAQTAAALRAGRDAGRPARRAMLVGLRDLELFGRAVAGERVRFEVRVVRDLPPLTLVEGEARLESSGALLCRGELKFHVEPAA